MSQQTFDTGTQDLAGGSRRRSLLALGGAGLLAAFAGRSSTEAKKNKSKKKCSKEKKQCRSQVEDFCASFGNEAPECEADLLPCCATCKVGSGVICVADLLVAEGTSARRGW